MKTLEEKYPGMRPEVAKARLAKGITCHPIELPYKRDCVCVECKRYYDGLPPMYGTMRMNIGNSA